ncbi:MAG: metalloregulator ArsR/SmtB family transcription factor [Candidatus Nanopelagicales bacterium]
MTIDVCTLANISTDVNILGVVVPTKNSPSLLPLVDDLNACCSNGLAAPLSREDAEGLAQLLKAVADPVRLQLLSIIASNPDGETCACDLTEPVGLSQPTVSHHLKVLTQAGILNREQRGTWAWFSVNPERLTAIATLFK